MTANKKANTDRDNFYADVYAVVRAIPRGRVTSYGAIAKALGRPGAARLVGYAMRASIQRPELQLPAHRVLNRKGLLTGKHSFSPPGEMQRRLEAEGHIVKDDALNEFDDRFWDPAVELKVE
ncbi:MAG: MGMT family protein [Bacteroidota bacterium]